MSPETYPHLAKERVVKEQWVLISRLWKINMATTPHLHLPFSGDPKGVKREFGFKTYLQISAEPIP